MAVGPAALAVNTGAALYPCIIHYEPQPSGHGWRSVVTFHEAVAQPDAGTSREKIQVMTQACADVLTDAIRQHTQDWHMMQRVFTRDLAVENVSGSEPGSSGQSEPGS
jgi:KDO2-lipid IV(A) lauroyltransferase